MQNQLSKNAKISQVVTSANGVAGTTAIESVILDMSSYVGVLFMVIWGVITAGAVTSIKARQSDNSDMSSAEDLEGTSQTIADTADGSVSYLDLKAPTKRYVQLYISRATQNAVVAGAVALQYGPRFAPVTHGSLVTGEAHVSPDAGTA